jgi:hypothetical protein
MSADGSSIRRRSLAFRTPHLARWASTRLMLATRRRTKDSFDISSEKYATPMPRQALVYACCSAITDFPMIWRPATMSRSPGSHPPVISASAATASSPSETRYVSPSTEFKLAVFSQFVCERHAVDVFSAFMKLFHPPIDPGRPCVWLRS